MSGTMYKGIRTKSQLYLAVMIGPVGSGKTTFGTIAYNYFRQYNPPYTMDLMVLGNRTSPNTVLYVVKEHAISVISGFHRFPHFEHKKLFVVDADCLHNEELRFHIYMFCLAFDIIYLQIYMHFEPIDIIIKLARRGVFFNHSILKNPEFYNTSFMCVEPHTKWHHNCITIFQKFRRDGRPEVQRLFDFLKRCTLPKRDDVWIKSVPKIFPFEYHNHHQLQMRAGISYRDKLLNGRGYDFANNKM